VSDELFREVDEEVRQEQYFQLWKKYGVYVAGIVFAVVAVAVAVVLWREHQLSQREADGERMLAAIAVSTEKPDEALDQFAKLADQGTSGYRLLARLREAALLAQKGDARGAVAIYDGLAADDAQDQIYRDLAKVLAVAHGMAIMDRGEVETRLTPVAADGNPWRYSARELMATAAVASGDGAAAREAFQRLVDDTDAPAGVRARAAEMLAALAQ